MTITFLMLLSIIVSALRRHFQEFVKQERRVARARVRLWVELHRENRLAVVKDALHRAVVDVDAVHLGVLRQALGLYHITVVLRGKVGAILMQEFDRMVRAAVTVFHALRLAADGKRGQLMSETDGKGRHAVIIDLTDLADDVY